MSEASMAMGLMTWWAAVCRVGAMHMSTHRLGVIRWHQAVGVGGLVLAWLAARGPADPELVATSAALLATMVVTLREWRCGPPLYTVRPELLAAMVAR